MVQNYKSLEAKFLELLGRNSHGKSWLGFHDGTPDPYHGLILIPFNITGLYFIPYITQAGWNDHCSIVCVCFLWFEQIQTWFPPRKNQHLTGPPVHRCLGGSPGGCKWLVDVSRSPPPPFYKPWFMAIWVRGPTWDPIRKGDENLYLDNAYVKTTESSTGMIFQSIWALHQGSCHSANHGGWQK